MLFSTNGIFNHSTTMAKSFFIIIPFICFHISWAQDNPKAEIEIDLNKDKMEISPLIFGQFIEYLGRCIDGGIYEEGSQLSNEDGFRKDVLESVQNLQTPLLRFPGGTVIKVYNWKDGIGPRETRPKRRNLIWGGMINNNFGTAECIKYCREIEAEPSLVVNMSTDSPMSAANWVEYCNGNEDTYWANLRRSHGYKQPFNVKYWGIGNEEYAIPDAGIHQDVDTYIKDSWQFVKLMKLQDPTIKITLVGTSMDYAWTRKVLAEMHPVCDYISIHHYAMPNNNQYSTLIQKVENVGASLDSMRVILNEIPEKVEDFPRWYRFPARSEPVKVAIDEWGIWDIDSDKGSGTYNLEYPYNWSHALMVAKFLHIFQRNADIVGLGNWAQTVNVLAPVMTTKEGSYEQTVYTPLQAYREHCQNYFLPIAINAPQFENDFKILDANATISSGADRITVQIINLSDKDHVATQVSFKALEKDTKIYLSKHVNYTAPSLDATNTMTKNVVKKNIQTNSNGSKKLWEIKIPAMSMNFLVFELPDR
jgi:alpha-N-arabinofuranosidase